MNRIIVSRDGILSDSDNVLINGNVISLLSDDTYLGYGVFLCVGCII